MTLCNIQEAAYLLGLEAATVLELALDGTLTAVRDRRAIAFDRDEVQRLAERVRAALATYREEEMKLEL